jgi:hypothetical protein
MIMAALAESLTLGAHDLQVSDLSLQQQLLYKEG